MKKINIKLEGTGVYCLDDADHYLCFRDPWLTDKERIYSVYQGIQSANIGQISVGAGNADTATQPDASIAAAYGNRFCIPLDFELLTDYMPFYQSGLKHQLSFELTFNDYRQVIVSTNKTATYKINNIALEFDMVTHHELARSIRMQYLGQVAILYTRVIRHNIKVKKSDDSFTIHFNTPAKSFKGMLLLFEDPTVGTMGPAFGHDSESFYNPLVKKVEVTVEGVPNQLYSQGICPYNHWGEIFKGFAREYLKDAELPSIDHTNYFQNRYGLWLDFRMSCDQIVHGSGRRIESSGITLQIKKTAQKDEGVLNCYIYLLSDAQLNIADGALYSIIGRHAGCAVFTVRATHSH